MFLEVSFCDSLRDVIVLARDGDIGLVSKERSAAYFDIVGWMDWMWPVESEGLLL